MKQNRSARTERPIRPAVRKQAVHGKDTIPELPITVEIGRRAGEYDLAIGLQRDPYRPFFRVGADLLANKATSSECPIQAPPHVEPNDGDLAADSAADHDPTASLYCDAAGCVVAAEGGVNASTPAKGWVERTGSRRRSTAHERGQ